MKTLKFNSFEKYPPQFMTIYLRCDGVHRKSGRKKIQFIRVNQFNAATFDPKEVERRLDNCHVDWSYTWLPADEIDKQYDKGDFN